MKNLLLKLTGFGKIIRLQKEVNNLIVTVEKLKQEATEAYRKSQDAIILYKKLRIDREEEKWWEKTLNSFEFDDFERYILASNIRKEGARQYMKETPALKQKFIFHGGCLSCKTPTIEGWGSCLGCSYSGYNSSLPDLSEKYK